MRFFQSNGNPLYVSVATPGARGVEDAYCTPPIREIKARLREREQRESCRFFGLPEAHLHFLLLEEDQAGDVLDNAANADRLRQILLGLRPALVFLPHGHDTNKGHQRVYAMFRRVAQTLDFPLVAFLNQDPKTIKMRCDVYLGFDEDMAIWKGKLLRFHRSQQERNLNQRGYGFDERILRMNRESAETGSIGATYAEVFEIEFFGSNSKAIPSASHLDSWIEYLV
jgi:LmbE family N-acetylglucosaminyl deacetylase